MPALGSDRLKARLTGVPVQQVIKEVLGGFSGSLSVNTGVLLFPVREALQRLEHANLVMRMADGVDNSSRWRITSAGDQALANGGAAAKLAPSDPAR